MVITGTPGRPPKKRNLAPTNPIPPRSTSALPTLCNSPRRTAATSSGIRRTAPRTFIFTATRCANGSSLPTCAPSKSAISSSRKMDCRVSAPGFWGRRIRRSGIFCRSATEEGFYLAFGSDRLRAALKFTSYHVRDLRFHLLKIHHPGHHDCHHHRRRHQQHSPGGFPVPESDQRKPSITPAIGFNP